MMRYRIAVLILACCSLTGCGGDGSGLKTYPAGGVVKFTNGQPIAGATVSFLSPQNDLARAVTDAEGKFQLGTFEETDGAVAGKHRVAVVPPIIRGGDAKSAPVEVPGRFKTAETSGIEVEVKPDGENQFQIEVERAGR